MDVSPATGPLMGDAAGAVEGLAVAAGGNAGAVAGASFVTQP